MLTRLVFLFSLISTGTVFLTGAWPDYFTPPAVEANSAFVAQAVPLDADLVGPGLDAKQLLKQALDAVSTNRAPWLRTRIRQTMADAQSNFVAEGFLQRGPNYCARLEMNIATGDQPSRLIVVSDGDVIAQERKILDREPIVVVEQLSDENDAGKDDVLIRKGCGGPSAILRQMHDQLKNATLQTGLLNDVPVIRIKGDIDPEPTATSTAGVPRHGYVYLNAKTLWPERVEWCGVDTLRPILRIEFLQPDVQRALNVEECVRTFSYP